MHSDSQELLLEATSQCCKNGKMLWEDAKKLGVFLWLKSAETAVCYNCLLALKAAYIRYCRGRNWRLSRRIDFWQMTIETPHLVL